MRPEQQIALAQSHAAAMGQQIADGHLMRDVRVVHHEAGKALVDRIVPGELARIYQTRQRGGGERFRVGSDREHGLRIHRRRVTQLADTVAFCEHDLSVFHDGHCHPRNIEGVHRIGNVGIQSGWSGD